jgi:hypothetical protein
LPAGRVRRMLVLIGITGLLGVSGVVGAALPAAASTFQITLSASPSSLGFALTSTLTATITPGSDAPGFTGLIIYDNSTGVFAPCTGDTTTCTVKWPYVTKGDPTTQAFTAYAVDGPRTPDYAVAYSAPVFVTWTKSGFTISLISSIFDGGPVTVTATVHGHVPSTSYIYIFDETTGQTLNECQSMPTAGSGNTCSVGFQPTSNGDSLIAFIAPPGQSWYPPESVIQASSNVLLLINYLSLSI